MEFNRELMINDMERHLKDLADFFKAEFDAKAAEMAKEVGWRSTEANQDMT